MVDLVGGLSTYSGDPNNQVLVSVPTISAGCVNNDQGVPALLQVLVGDNCDPYYSTEEQVILDAQSAAARITNDRLAATPCDWLAYYGPLAFVQNFGSVPTPPEQDVGYYRIFGVWIHNYRLRTFPIPTFNCWESNTKGGSRYYGGNRPVPVHSVPNTKYCFWDDDHDSFTPDGSSTIPGPFGDSFIRTGTGVVTYLGPEEDGGPPTTFLNGEVFMPIPPIPDGYPPPPAPPPLQGQLTIDEVSQEVAQQIVILGGGFRTITDIANEYELEPEVAQIDYHERTNSPNDRTIDILEFALGTVPTSFWATLDLGQGGTGGGYTLTLPKMIAAYLADDVPTQVDWLEKQTSTFILQDLLNAFVLADTEVLQAPLRQSLKVAVQSNKVILPPVVVKDPAAEDTSLDISWDINFKAYMKLKLGRDTVGSDNDFSEVVARYCNKDLAMPIPVITTRKSDGTVITDAPYKNLILDLLYEIRECCNPCLEAASDNAFDEDFWGDQTSRGAPVKSMSMHVPNIHRVVFQVTENNFPKVVYFGTPPLLLLAKFAWLDSDGRWGPIQYVNMNAATLIAPHEDIVGYMCHCYVGVVLHASVYQRGGPSKVNPNAPP